MHSDYRGTSFLSNINSLFLVLIFLFLLPLSSNLLAQATDEDCLTCHSDEELTMEKKGKTVPLYVNEKTLKSSVHSKISCTSCHTGFNAEEMPHKENITPINCVTCHKNAGVKHLFHPQILNAKGTNGTPDVSCKGCHGTHDVKRIKSSKPELSRQNKINYCSKCHADQVKEYESSIHARGLKNNVQGSPDCLLCHTSNIVIKPEKSDTLKIKIAQGDMCLSCHLDDPNVKGRVSPTANFIKSYENSVHGKALKAGNKEAPTCVDCHESHNVLPGRENLSSVAKVNIPATCGKCHADIAKEFSESIHGVAAARGNNDSPVCTDCHGEHNILKAQDPNSPVAFRNVAEQVCAPCHSSVKLSEKYGISANKFSSFVDSYHGLAIKGGSKTVANCASCHGVHNIKPSSDPTSLIHKSNLANTCGTCHPGANENFTKGSVHVTLEKDEEPILYWIAYIYILLIGSTIGAMFFHNFIDFVKKAKIRKMKQRGLIKHEHHGHSLYLRMTLNERIQHVALFTSFFALVITGFMLRFPDAWWVRSINDLSPSVFELRSLIHRIAAVVMVAASFYHMYYLAFTPRGKQLFVDLLPRLQDAKDAVGVLKFNLGLSSDKPKLDRFSYIEKAEYWALIWGTIVMTVTGVIMWFDNTFMNLFTKLGWDIARTIHYYEAWLAFLSIVIWHFYFVLFNPDIYPMSLAWIKGTLTEEEMAEEHPLELERIKAKEEEQNKSEETKN
ncbi:MAG: cytochrome b/b6 domain-containing protein [Ignavibacteriaceae bacterium]|nr:cytochrome b/b6 domain-containing protein [Ignavibacteriaceae bacterium]